MELALWLVTGLLAVVYLGSGTGKLLVSRERMAGLTPAAGWVLDFSPGAFRAIGAVEVLGAAGLVLPAVTGVAPVLVPLAALGLALVMAGATVVRLRRGEPKYAVLDVAYLLLALFVAVGRFAVA
ncbi:DoxX family protein [Amycolatopsis sp. 195334CR]|uniref:DoxX family protein n=1 Tax=Amycolatopsis sp. 195334CR TaxID=2814588 RepID=UPI001A8F5C33|nr:DoxX family protein [Amycolatopsis sp. 195334CR]MBN6033664.1 DoxX family protein [Amycolatopsis sp. 195334CR]